MKIYKYISFLVTAYLMCCNHVLAQDFICETPEVDTTMQFTHFGDDCVSHYGYLHPLCRKNVALA